MNLKKKVLYAFIRLTALAIIIGCVSHYYNEQCEYYREKMFEAMEERDMALSEIVLLESDIEELTSQPSIYIQEKAAKERTQKELNKWKSK